MDKIAAVSARVTVAASHPVRVAMPQPPSPSLYKPNNARVVIPARLKAGRHSPSNVQHQAIVVQYIARGAGTASEGAIKKCNVGNKVPTLQGLEEHLDWLKK